MDKTQIPLERAITDKITAWLRELGPRCWFIKVHGSSYQLTGVPDIIGVFGGRFFALEVKRPKHGRLTVLQAVVMRKIREAGGLVREVRSLEEAMAALEEVRLNAR